MYDYVLQYAFDKENTEYIQSIKDYLKNNGIEDRERNWLPHITIDLYKCDDKNEFINKVDSIVEKIDKFNLEFNNLNSFNNETLYIEPYNKDNLMKLKILFNEELNKYMLDKRRDRKYAPHVTLCTNDELEKSNLLASSKFKPFIAQVQYIWIYSRNMELIKEYELK